MAGDLDFWAPKASLRSAAQAHQFRKLPYPGSSSLIDMFQSEDAGGARLRYGLPVVKQQGLRLRLQDPVDFRPLDDRERDRSWFGHRPGDTSDDKDLMSQQHGTGSAPSSTSAHDASAGRPPATRSFTSPTGPPPAAGNPSGGARSEGPGNWGPSLPPIQQPMTGPSATPESRMPRALGVHSILNSPQAGGPDVRGQRRTASQMESQSPVERGPGPPSAFFSPPSNIGAPSEEQQRLGYMSQRGHRRILSPRSPVYRTQSLSMIRPATGTIRVQDQPFLSPGTREYTIESGLPGNQPAPAHPMYQRPPHNFPPPSAPTPPIPHSQPRRASGSFRQGPQSASASPSAMYSSYGASSQTSPATTFSPVPGPSTPGSFIQGPTSGSVPSLQMEQERSYGIPVASTGQSSYQLITLETNQGHVQIPVDVQAASKMADEKRKRNAGASARFRARRKEKEKEASTTISRLEQQLRDANDDSEYYRRERDFFAQLVYAAPGGDRHFPRPPSPRTRRVSMAGTSSAGASSQRSTSAGSTPGVGFQTFPERTERADSERNVRRRTSTYLPPPQGTPGQPQQPQLGYLPPSYAPIGTSMPTSQTPSSGSQQQASPTILPGFRDPFPQPQRPDRSWPPPPPPGPSHQPR
ncbi:hypothetical protein K490DRAFT_64199 [Saccharata proteae CBS 121410]|uniref:BZIP domain-containing protein n=1 Tax=Saccharata proteae CBS 121410 TaxID=1314787 RepID=A0A6A5YDQ7_9PEZI|nr:hypothetical protein K490DRAFT_64199 [Saccharata proteae CBS 121410]